MADKAPDILTQQLPRRERAKYEALAYLNDKFTPHSGQMLLLDAWFNRGCRFIFGRCGRNFGKSHGSVYGSLRHAIINPGSRCYYFAPLLKQAKDIVWHPQLIEEMLDPNFILSIDNQDTRVRLINGSYIKLDGSENYNSQRGYKPDLVVADEYREFHPQWSEVMFPNLIARKAVLVMIGTPPDHPVLPNGEKHHYVVMDEEIRGRMQADDPRAFWVHLPSETNPHLDPEELKAERQRHIDRGEAYVAQREYDALIVTGSKLGVFPMYNRDVHEIAHDKLMEILRKDPGRYELWCAGDPATRSIFGVLFMAIDKYDRKVYWLDEIYENDPSFTVAKAINEQIYEKIQELNESLLGDSEDISLSFADWNFIADNAAAAYIEESFVESDFPIAWTPTVKQLNDKKQGVSLIQSILLEQSACISDRCEKFQGEISNYARDHRGFIKKVGDHLIDDSRYVLKAADFDFNREERVVKQKVKDTESYMVSAPAVWRKRKLEEDPVEHILAQYE